MTPALRPARRRSLVPVPVPEAMLKTRISPSRPSEAARTPTRKREATHQARPAASSGIPRASERPQIPPALGLVRPSATHQQADQQ